VLLNFGHPERKYGDLFFFLAGQPVEKFGDLFNLFCWTPCGGVYGFIYFF